MDLMRFDLVGAVLCIPPEDCANLARFCQLAESAMTSRDYDHLRDLAESYGALFRACALAGFSLGELYPGEGYNHLADSLDALGLADLLSPQRAPVGHSPTEKAEG